MARNMARKTVPTTQAAPLKVSEADVAAWLAKHGVTVVRMPRPRAKDGDVIRLLRNEAEPNNQRIVDALRAHDKGVSFQRVDALRLRLRLRR